MYKLNIFTNIYAKMLDIVIKIIYNEVTFRGWRGIHLTFFRRIE